MKKNLLSFFAVIALLLVFGFRNIRNNENLVADNLKAYGNYTIGSTDNKLLEISGEVMQGDKLKDGAKVIATSPAKQLQRWQKWLISKHANGYYTIMNLNSGKYIGVSSNDSLCQYRLSKDKAQCWDIASVGAGIYKLVNHADGKALSLENENLSLQEYKHRAGQNWALNAIKADSYRDDNIIAFFERTKGSTAFDEGASIPLSYGPNKGKVMWLTGDTFYDQVDGKGEFACNLIFPYHNAALIQPANHSWDPNKTVNITSPDGVQIFHTINPKNLLWPGVGIEIGKHVYVHCIEVITGTLNTVNQYLADVSETDGTTIPAVKLISIPNVSGQTKLIYSLGMIKPGDGYIYTYALGGFFGASVYVARFLPSQPTKWTFWNGKTWGSKPSDKPAAVIAKGPINNNTVGYVNGKYVLITMDYGFTCDVTTRNMYAAVSNSPTGPFINKKLVYVLPDYKQGHAPVYYNPTIHAEFNNGHKELLVNYCINFYNTNDKANGTCLTPCSNPDGTEDPNDYRPKGVRIPFSLIGL